MPGFCKCSWFNRHTVDGQKSGEKTSWGKGSLSVSHRDLHIPGGAGFLPSTVWIYRSRWIIFSQPQWFFRDLWLQVILEMWTAVHLSSIKTSVRLWFLDRESCTKLATKRWVLVPLLGLTPTQIFRHHPPGKMHGMWTTLCWGYKFM